MRLLKHTPPLLLAYVHEEKSDVELLNGGDRIWRESTPSLSSLCPHSSPLPTHSSPIADLPGPVGMMGSASGVVALLPLTAMHTNWLPMAHCAPHQQPLYNSKGHFHCHNAP